MSAEQLPLPDWFLTLHPVGQALIATLFTWALTALGAATVFLRRNLSRRALDISLGFTGGVMIAASYWSLLAPSLDMAERSGLPAWLPAAIGFLAGAIVLRVADSYMPHLHLFLPKAEAEGVQTSLKRVNLLVLAITLHNIPEGLAVGVAFAGAAMGDPTYTLGAAIALAIGIGIQNCPEGAAVSLPLRREGFSRRKSFWYGQLSAVVEPVAGVLGAAIVILMQPLLPYALAFAAGAMIFVVVEEVVPESQQGGHPDAATMGLMAGFTVMMILDVALG